jgi:hypothetical protein
MLAFLRVGLTMPSMPKLARVPRAPFSSIALAGFLVLIPFENFLTGFRDVLLWGCAIALIVEMRGEIGSWLRARGWSWLRPILAGIGFLATAVALTFVIGTIRGDLEYAGEAAVEALKRLIPFALVMPLVFVASLSVEKNFGEFGTAGKWAPRLIAASAVWWALACAYGIDPKTSYESFFKEGGLYLLAFFVVLLKFRSEPASAPRWIALVVLVGGLVGAIALTEFGLGSAGSDELREDLIEREFIRESGSGDEVMVRSQFPFSEHNRLASYLLAACLLAPLGIGLNRERGLRIALAASAALAFIGIVLSGTRGAMLAAAAGLGVMAMAKPRIFAGIVPVLILVFIALPGSARYHVQTILDPETYRDKSGSVQLRLQGWSITGEMIRDKPLLGFGYGWEIYESIYPQYSKEREFFEENMPHAHNNVFELTVETGLIGGGLFVAYQICLFWMTIRLLRGRNRDLAPPWLPWAALGLLVGLHFFGMTNFSLRSSVGFQIWICFAMLQAILSAPGLVAAAIDGTNKIEEAGAAVND